MEQSVIHLLQEEARQAYERLPQPEAAANAQVVMLAEIALQLARLNELLEIEKQPAYPSRICDKCGKPTGSNSTICDYCFEVGES